MWNHNLHFHDFLLRHIPAKLECALDIGCGLGDFSARLAERSRQVDALDKDQAVIAAARQLHHEINIHFTCSDFLNEEAIPEQYDCICAIASLHHLDMRVALARMKFVLRPGGVIAILGLYRETSLLDYGFSLASIPLNKLYELRYVYDDNGPLQPLAPTRPPTLTLREIAQVASDMMPGSRLKQHLLWRYSLFWHKPAS